MISFDIPNEAIDVRIIKKTLWATEMDLIPLIPLVNKIGGRPS